MLPSLSLNQAARSCPSMMAIPWTVSSPGKVVLLEDDVLLAELGDLTLDVVDEPARQRVLPPR